MKRTSSLKSSKPCPEVPSMVNEFPASKPANCAGNLNRAGDLLVITGPSGVGKGTLVERVLKQSGDLQRSVSVTTRERRTGEVEGQDYFFLTTAEFQRIRHADELMEWAEFAGALYGTPKAWVEQRLKEGQHVLLEIEVQGAKQIRERFPLAVLIFVSPPSLESLEQRLVGRATETPEKIALRLQKAQQELAEKHLFHYEVINDNIDEAVNNLLHIIYAERCRIRNPG